MNFNTHNISFSAPKPKEHNKQRQKLIGHKSLEQIHLDTNTNLNR